MRSSPAPLQSSEAVDGSSGVVVVALAVSASGRLLCALTAQCVWLYSVLADDCVCLGGWKRSPRLHGEEGDNTAVAFNHTATSTARREEEEEDDDDSEDGREQSGSGERSLNAEGAAEADGTESVVAADESQCVLSVLTSRHVLNVLRVAHRPDLARLSQQHYSASDAGRPPAATPAPSAPASSSHSLQSSLSLSWSTSEAPSAAVDARNTAALFGFPAGEWHDAVTLSAAVHSPLSVHLLARVKLSNDSIRCVAACHDGFLLGTAGGFIQRVALDGRPVACMHAALAVEPRQQQQHDSADSMADSGSPLALRCLRVSHTLHALAFVLWDGRVGVCDERLLRASATGSGGRERRQERIDPLIAPCWLRPSPGCPSADAAVCLEMDDSSRRLAVGWRRSVAAHTLSLSVARPLSCSV